MDAEKPIDSKLPEKPKKGSAVDAKPAEPPDPDILTPPEDRLPSARAMMRVVGWGVIYLWLLDAMYIFAALDWMNPISELRTCGRMVDHVWAPLFGMLLLLLPTGSEYTPKEARNLSSTVRFCYVFALIFFAIAPFSLLSAGRIHRAMDQQLASAIAKQHMNTQVAIDKLNGIRTRQELYEYVQDLQLGPTVFEEPSFYQLKQELAKKFDIIDDDMARTARRDIRRRLQGIWLDAIKWAAGAFIGALAFGLLAQRSRRYHDMAMMVGG